MNFKFSQDMINLYGQVLEKYQIAFLNILFFQYYFHTPNSWIKVCFSLCCGYSKCLPCCSTTFTFFVSFFLQYYSDGQQHATGGDKKQISCSRGLLIDDSLIPHTNTISLVSIDGLKNSKNVRQAIIISQNMLVLTRLSKTRKLKNIR